ncbi:MAG: integrase [Bryobacteraceae bacterium]
MQTKAPNPPGLRILRGKPIWRATRAAVKAGYPVKSVNLSLYAGDQDAIARRCSRLQIEMNSWLSGRRGNVTTFDGTIRSLVDLYQADRESPYHGLPASTRDPYDVYLRVLRAEVGERQIDRCDARDVRRWFAAWTEGIHLAKGKMIIAVLKAILSFGIQCRNPGCAEFKAILSEIKFPALPSRDQAPTAAQITAARTAAKAAGHAAAALAYSLQFEGTLRQWDACGQWVPIGDKRTSTVLYRGKKWLGPHWSQVDENLVLRFKPTKTAFTSGAEVAIDLSVCPMVMEDLEEIPAEQRTGPMIKDPKTGRPYTKDRFSRVWRAARKAAGIPTDVWNRDLRAGGTTEAREADAKTDDLKKLVGHTAGSKMTADVYDRARLEAHRRVASARKTKRDAK